MSTIHIQHPHQLGLAKARVIAADWIQSAEKKMALTCEYKKGTDQDSIHFKRQGVTGVMWVRANEFEIEAKLGMFLAMFQTRIESEIIQNLQERLQ
ncbi:MAG: polyhydroxyalkanoic acid system family protein [Cytophagales bacterium]|nr:polyhydroxyalkanoic acid system family protein [Cytophagales bacterium]